MKVFKKGLLGAAILVCSGLIFANCPQISGYSASGGANVQVPGVCHYVANEANPAAARNPKLCYPGNRLTDPNYRVKSCSFNQFSQKCMCTVVRKVK